ncbi:hemerythrin domain-containing protein [Rhodoferax sp. GW822-FHT02A01]|uniref:hemerythrin domain-containing protein n=1 Tax=Rhodoferax sp. GW822-FHT02A01 TaxID=3141537 RepID=UPI00315C85AB
MTAVAPLQPFEALDACHLQIQRTLQDLTRLARRLETGGVNEMDRKLAGDIESFFSNTSREHHAEEEAHVFPQILASGSAKLSAAVKSLQQDHGFIEENWIELAPQLRAIAEGNDWVHAEEFQHNVSTFLELLNGHIALEESLIYPESKAMWAATIARRR